MQYTINVDLANKVLAYLGTRPYQEVADIISGFQNKALFSEIKVEEKVEDGTN